MPTGIYKRTPENTARYWLGKKRGPMSEITKKRISESNRVSQKGKVQSEETKIRRGIYKSGSQSPQWKGGISKDQEHLKRLSKKWKEENRDRNLYLNAQYRARRRNAEGTFSYSEWEETKTRYNNCCARCNKHESVIMLTIDHIIPLIRGGSNYITNIQPLCRSCNCSKGGSEDKLIEYIKGKLEPDV